MVNFYTDLQVVASALLIAAKFPDTQLTVSQKISLVRKCLHLILNEDQCERAAELIQGAVKVLAVCITDEISQETEDLQPDVASEEEAAASCGC